MNLIKTGIGITRTIKNVARLKEIISVFARNGFDEFIIKTGIHDKIPEFVLPKSRITEAIEEKEGMGPNWPSTLGYRLRKAFEELGPCFIKLGQLMSTREDMFEQGFIDEMKKLLDQVKGIPFEEGKRIIEKALGGPLEDYFSDIETVPIGTASIAVVYKGTLKDGSSVVIKVRRPNIVKLINTDVSILLFLVERLEKVSKEIRYLGISKLIQDFATNLRIEMDFHIESLNCQRLKSNIERWDTDNVFYLPKVYKEYSREDILVLEFLDGIPFSQENRILEFREEVKEKLLTGIHVFIESLLQDGFFHADLHGGNFFLLKNGRIGIIDFGLMGSLEKKGRMNLIAILHFLVSQNFENLVYEFLDVAEYEEIPDIDILTRDVKECLTPYIGLTIQQTNFTALISSVVKTMSSHRIFLPREWFIVFRAMATLDGVGKSLGIDFDIFSIIEKEIKNTIAKVFSKEELLSEGLWVGRNFLSSVRLLPRHLKWFIKEFSRNNYAFEVIHRGYEKELGGIHHALIFLGYSILSGMLAMGGAILLGRNEANFGIHSFLSLPGIFFILAAAASMKAWMVTRKR